MTGREPEAGKSGTRSARSAPVLSWQFTLELGEGDVDVGRICSHSALGSSGQDGFDVLLHVAGISGRKFGDGPLHECSDEGWECVMQTNARGVFLTNRAAVRLMLDQRPDATGLRGSVVNVGSVVDRSPSPTHFGTVAYAASKGAVRALTLAAAARYAADRIRFNLLTPGLIDTPMAARAVNDLRLRPYLAQPNNRSPAGRVRPATWRKPPLYLCRAGLAFCHRP